jgi:muconolactone delta-isomerase
MKYLVTLTPRRLQMPTVALIEAAQAWLKARMTDKTMDCCYGFVAGGGVAIISAESPEKLAQILMEYPAYFMADWKIDPLCDGMSNMEQVKAMVKRAGP